MKFKGRKHKAIGSWIIVGPPNYAPGVQAIVTGYDLIFEVATKMAPSLRPRRPSFSRHIFPLLERFVRYQWVNAGFAREFGWGLLSTFTASTVLSQLSDPGLESRSIREAVFERFRSPLSNHPQADQWPGVYGDDVTLQADTRDPLEWMSVLSLQY